MMKNNKLVTIMLILLIAIALVGAAALIIVLKYTGENSKSEPTIDEVLDVSVDVNDITTNLGSNDYIRISFKIQTDSKKAKKELEKRDFQVRNIIIQTLSEKTAEELEGKEGKEKLEEDLKNQIDEIMQEGNIVRVYITDSLLQ